MSSTLDARPQLPTPDRLALLRSALGDAYAEIQELRDELRDLRETFEASQEAGVLAGTLRSDDPPPFSEQDLAGVVFFALHLREEGRFLLELADELLAGAQDLGRDDHWPPERRQALRDWHRRHARM